MVLFCLLGHLHLTPYITLAAAATHSRYLYFHGYRIKGMKIRKISVHSLQDDKSKPYVDCIDPSGIQKGSALLYRLGQHTMFLSLMKTSIDGIANMKSKALCDKTVGVSFKINGAAAEIRSDSWLKQSNCMGLVYRLLIYSRYRDQNKEWTTQESKFHF